MKTSKLWIILAKAEFTCGQRFPTHNQVSIRKDVPGGVTHGHRCLTCKPGQHLVLLLTGQLSFLARLESVVDVQYFIASSAPGSQVSWRVG